MTSPVPPTIVAAQDLIIGTGRTRKFVGLDHGADISYFFVDNAPGEGPELHWHPYSETWVVLDGVARITIGSEVLTATAGDTATAASGVWHGFKNAGTDRLQILGIHASDTIIQTFAE